MRHLSESALTHVDEGRDFRFVQAQDSLLPRMQSGRRLLGCRGLCLHLQVEMLCGSRQQLRSRLLPALLGSKNCTLRRGEPVDSPGFLLPVSACAYGAAAGPAGAGGWYETLAASAPAHWAEAMFLGAQGATGLPWWASIVVTTAALRSAVTLPLAVYQHYILAKVENLQPEIKIIAKNLNYDIAFRAKQLGWSKRVTRLTYLNNMRRIVSELYIRDNCHPFKATLLVWIQIPMWVFMSVALRNFSLGITDSEGGFSIQEQFSTGGVLWFPDLTLLDSTWILPVSLGILNLLIVEIFALQKLEMSRFQKYITYFTRGISVLMIPIAATVPSAIALYWFSSSLLGLSQNLLLRSPGFRQLCRIPMTRSYSDTPYKDLFAAFYSKFFLRK
ncbi:cytochrome c oxidase assembly protein COX18, mitochondrial [Monodelphis domestica]|uniref:cytochrome c oxidase assembly protein COX18, mitochondrial n=1 Tax=Monodelphis domestica TaxID=13616 RepID=UPI0024E2741F|nr:cytochrome c oxidase assembly protein COX18, mitochondrial [Monodelphis domestica]